MDGSSGRRRCRSSSALAGAAPCPSRWQRGVEPRRQTRGGPIAALELVRLKRRNMLERTANGRAHRPGAGDVTACWPRLGCANQAPASCDRTAEGRRRDETAGPAAALANLRVAGRPLVLLCGHGIRRAAPGGMLYGNNGTAHRSASQQRARCGRGRGRGRGRAMDTLCLAWPGLAEPAAERIVAGLPAAPLPASPSLAWRVAPAALPASPGTRLASASAGSRVPCIRSVLLPFLPRFLFCSPKLFPSRRPLDTTALTHFLPLLSKFRRFDFVSSPLFACAGIGPSLITRLTTIHSLACFYLAISTNSPALSSFFRYPDRVRLLSLPDTSAARRCDPDLFEHSVLPFSACSGQACRLFMLPFGCPT